MGKLSFGTKLLSAVKSFSPTLTCRYGERLVARAIPSSFVILVLSSAVVICLCVFVAFRTWPPAPPPELHADVLDVKEMLARATLLEEKLRGEIEFSRIGERIKVNNAWVQRNIVTITIPQLIGVPSLAGNASRVRFHKDGRKNKGALALGCGCKDRDGGRATGSSAGHGPRLDRAPARSRSAT